MSKLNNKGFTLVEVLAVIVILGIIMAIMAPNVSILLEKSKEDNYEHLEKSIVSAAKMYISDYKYKISVVGSCPASGSGTLKIKEIIDGDGIDDNNELTDSRISIKKLVNEGNLETDNDGNILNPKDKEQKLNKESSYIEVLYDCDTKGYKYETPELEWIPK